MTGIVIRGKFPQPTKFGKITAEQLAALTKRVADETDVKDVVASFTTYCHERDLRPSPRAHYDWAHEVLGTVFVQQSEDQRIRR
jgi:hypothetical protein